MVGPGRSQVLVKSSQVKSRRYPRTGDRAPTAAHSTTTLRPSVRYATRRMALIRRMGGGSRLSVRGGLADEAGAATAQHGARWSAVRGEGPGAAAGTARARHVGRYVPAS